MDGWDAFAIIGFVTFSWLTFKLVCSLFRGIRTHFLASKFGLSADLTSFGEWAVVTGATDGIGKAYAQQLAEVGLNIVLISRSTNKLEKVAADIEKTYKVQTKIITTDFTEAEGIYDDIEAKLDGLKVGVLVNNVGMSNFPGKLLDTPNLNKFIPDIIHCNCLSMTMMIQICLPQMTQRKKGVILNISSLSAVFPIPCLAVYSGTKAYMDLFSRALHYEYRDSGIIVQSVMPSFVKTNMTMLQKSTWFFPEASTYVRGALETVGVESRTFGFVSHSLQGYIMGFVPEFLLPRIMISKFNRVRERLLKRMTIEERVKHMRGFKISKDGLTLIKE